jgi:hypothetical protein
MGIFIQLPFPGTLWMPKTGRRRQDLTDFSWSENLLPLSAVML